MNRQPLSLERFRAEYRNAVDGASRDQVLSDFWKEVADRGTPLIEADGNTVVFLFRGNDDSVKLTGDMTGWNTQLPLSRCEGTDLFSLKMSFPADARLDYMFVVDTGNTVLDPCNPRSVMGGFGPKSELAMPGFRQAPELEKHTDVPAGTLTTVTHSSAILKYEHTLYVYLPAGYESGANRYPVVYFQDGSDYLELAYAGRTLDNVIAGGSIQPVMAVFVVPPIASDRNRTTEYRMNELYAKFFASELAPFIDAQYRTLPRAQHRLVIGPSSGGLASLLIAFRYPEVFGLAASQSGFVSFGGDSIITLFESMPRRPLRLYIDAGVYETAVRPAGGDEENFLQANRRLRDVLIAQGYGAEYREFQDGHSWGRWRNELPSILRLFFAWRP